VPYVGHGVLPTVRVKANLHLMNLLISISNGICFVPTAMIGSGIPRLDTIRLCLVVTKQHARRQRRYVNQDILIGVLMLCGFESGFLPGVTTDNYTRFRI